jgi:hypothetical protein
MTVPFFAGFGTVPNAAPEWLPYSELFPLPDSEIGVGLRNSHRHKHHGRQNHAYRDCRLEPMQAQTLCTGV